MAELRCSFFWSGGVSCCCYIFSKLVPPFNLLILGFRYGVEIFLSLSWIIFNCSETIPTVTGNIAPHRRILL
jgi:hypothetical protein